MLPAKKGSLSAQAQRHRHLSNIDERGEGLDTLRQHTIQKEPFFADTGININTNISISGLVVEYIVAIDVTRARFPADALFCLLESILSNMQRDVVCSLWPRLACSAFACPLLSPIGASHGRSP